MVALGVVRAVDVHNRWRLLLDVRAVLRHQIVPRLTLMFDSLLVLACGAGWCGVVWCGLVWRADRAGLARFEHDFGAYRLWLWRGVSCDRRALPNHQTGPHSTPLPSLLVSLPC